MSVTAETPIATAVANGVTTAFSYSFTVLDADDLQVKGELVGVVTPYTRGIAYTLAGVGLAGGIVTFGTAPVSGTVITIYRQTQLERSTQYQDGGDLLADTLNADHDRHWLALQDLAAGNVVAPRVIRAPLGESLADMPAAAARASKYLGFDGSGNPVALTTPAGTTAVSAFMATALAAGDEPSAADVLLAGLQHTQDFRLSTSLASAVPTSDITNSSFVYIENFCGNKIALYDSVAGRWRMTTITATLGLGVTGLPTASLPYDVFVRYVGPGATNSFGVEAVAWASLTARATALTTQDGVQVKSGDPTRRYLGTFYLDGAKRANDTQAKRHLFNYYNRVRRPIALSIAVATWNYTTAVVRQANADTANQVQVMTGVAEDSVRLDLAMNAYNTGASDVLVQAGLGLNSTTVMSGTIARQTLLDPVNEQQMHARYEDVPPVGLNTFAVCEWSTAAGVTSWFGTGYGKNIQGSCLA